MTDVKTYRRFDEVESDESIIPSGAVFYEHRDTGEFDPTQDLPFEHQSWVPTWWDDFDDMCDPTGQKQITEMAPPPWLFRQINLGNGNLGTAVQVAKRVGKSPAELRRALRLRQFDMIEKWLEKSKGNAPA